MRTALEKYEFFIDKCLLHFCNIRGKIKFQLCGAPFGYLLYRLAFPVTRLESPNFDTLWIKILLNSANIFLWFVYLSPNLNSTQTQQFFNYLKECQESLTVSHPTSEILFAGDFNAHHAGWLSSFRTSPRGVQAHDFAGLFDLLQLIQLPTRIPDRPDHSPSTLDLFLSSKISQYPSTHWFIRP